jgi:hypothetical protein
MEGAAKDGKSPGAILAARNRVHEIVALAGLLMLGTFGSATDRDLQQGRTPPPATGSAPRLAEYGVPAGSALLLKLLTPLDSATASVDDQVEATLWSPVIQEGVELIPVGSVAIGQVVAVVRASKQTPLGAVTFAFTIVEHAETGSRAMLTTRKVVIEAPSRASTEQGRGRHRQEPTQAIMPAGTPLVAMTAEPLVVRIPR